MDNVLPIGKKHGCFIIIGGFEAYQEEVAKEQIADLEQEKQKFINGERSIEHNFKSVDDFDSFIQIYKSYMKYKCQCKCGKVHYINGTTLLRKNGEIAGMNVR